jgi:hypothetical protein
VKPQKDKVLTGLAGEYYVLAQLAERGFTAALTLGNSKNVDIIITSPNGRKLKRLKIKTSSLHLRTNGSNMPYGKADKTTKETRALFDSVTSTCKHAPS